jgi:hypothetical protein
VGFDVTDQLLTIFFCIRQIQEKQLEYNDTVIQLFIDFKIVYDTARRQVFYNILIEFRVTKNIFRLTEICLNKNVLKCV